MGDAPRARGAPGATSAAHHGAPTTATRCTGPAPRFLRRMGSPPLSRGVDGAPQNAWQSVSATFVVAKPRAPTGEALPNEPSANYPGSAWIGFDGVGSGCDNLWFVYANGT
jgi:hypothetical protein